MCLSRACTVVKVHLVTDLVRLGAGQTAGQGPTVAGQSGGERWSAVCQDGLQVTGQLLRRTTCRAGL